MALSEIQKYGLENRIYKTAVGYLNHHREAIVMALYDELFGDPGIAYSENEWQKAADETIDLAATLYLNWPLDNVEISDPYIQSVQKGIAYRILKQLGK